MRHQSQCSNTTFNDWDGQKCALFLDFNLDPISCYYFNNKFIGKLYQFRESRFIVCREKET